MLEVLQQAVDLEEVVDHPLLGCTADPLPPLRIRQQAVDRGADRREVAGSTNSPLSPSTI